MKNLRKSVGLVSIATLVAVSMLTGCGNTATNSSGPAVSSTAAPTVVQLEPVDIIWYNVGNGTPKDADLVNAKISEYLKDKINVTFKLTTFDWGSFGTKLNAMFAANEAFDICYQGGTDYVINATKGALADVTSLVDQYAPNAKKVLGDKFLSGASLNGKTYGFPVNKEQAEDFGFVFRKDLVEKYKIDLNTITKLSDLEPLFKMIKAGEPKDILPLAAGKTGSTDYAAMSWDRISGDSFAPGAVYLDGRDNKVINQYASDDYMTFAKQMHAWYQAGYISQDAATSQNTLDPALSGKAFCIPNQLKPGKDAEMSNKDFTWVQKSITPIYATNSDARGALNCISNTSKNKERAMMLLDLMHSDKTLVNMGNFGIEGTHYTKVSENVIEPIANSGYDYNGFQWEFGNQMLTYLKANEDPDKWAKFDAYNKSATPAKSLGFSFDASSVKTELPALGTVVQQYLPLINTGAGDPEVIFPEFNKALENAGMVKFIAELQRQYDAFLATK